MATPNGDGGIRIGEHDWRNGLAPAARPPGSALPVAGIDRFDKSLPHNSFGEVEPAAVADFVGIANGHQHDGDFEFAARGPVAWPLSFSFTSFNGKPTRIEGMRVLLGGAIIDPRATMLRAA